MKVIAYGNSMTSNSKKMVFLLLRKIKENLKEKKPFKFVPVSILMQLASTKLKCHYSLRTAPYQNP